MHTLLRNAMSWSVLWAGLVAGIVFMMLEMTMVALFLGEGSCGPCA